MSGVLAATLLVAAPGDAAFPGQNGRIAFEYGDDRIVGFTSGIWTMGPDGSHRVRVFKRRSASAYSPEISPSGRRIAFVRSDPQGLWIMRSDGSRLRRLTRGSVRDPAFSPNGKVLAYTSLHGRGQRIFITSASGGGSREAVTRVRGGGQGEPAFVGNRRILYTSFDGEGFQLYSIRTDGTHRRELTRGDDEYVSKPDVSPDRRRVAFVNGGGEICVLKLMARTRRCFAPDGLEDPSNLVWAKFSPNGRKLVYWEWRNGIIKVNRDGARAVRLSQAGARAPDWGPRVG